MHTHFQNEHDSATGMVLAPQAFPFRPTPDATPLPPLPYGSVPTYSVLPSLVLPARRKKKVKEPESIPELHNAEQHLTFWSCFEFGESLDRHEERRMREHDLDFQPLHHPIPLSGKKSWPGFAISAQPAAMSHMNFVSAPPGPTGVPPSKLNTPSAPQNFLYQAFKRYLEEKSF